MSTHSVTERMPAARIMALPDLAHTIDFHNPLDLHRVVRPFILRATARAAG